MSSQELQFNPYEAGKPVQADRFYGRRDLVREIIKTLTRTSQNAIVLHGQRRIGKTSLLHRLRRDETLCQDYVPFFFNVSGYETSPGRILHGLAKTIAGELDLNISPPHEASLTADYHQFQRTFLPQIYNHLNHKRLLILCDEFDVITSRNKTDRPWAEVFLGYLQTLVEAEGQHLAFIYTVGSRLDLLSQGYKRLFKGVQTKRVGRLEENDTYNLLTELGRQGGLSYSDEALAEIWVLTNGHPYLTQLIGSEIFDRLQEVEPRPASATDVSACLNKAMEHGSGVIGWFWDGLNREEQLIMTTVADLTDRDKSVSDAEIIDALQRHRLFMTETARRDAYKQLLESDFLLDVGKRRYQFAVEIIRLWVVKNYPLQTAADRDAMRGDPEARLHYELGQQASEGGKFGVAIQHYQDALRLDPDFVDPMMALAPLLRQDNIQAAIDLYEEAYKRDPERACDKLIEFRLDYIRQLEKEGDDEAILTQAQRILFLKSDQADARELVSRIYLKRIDGYLAHNNLAEAWGLAQQLAESVPILHEPYVAQQVRDKWLNYAQRLSQQNPPNWDEAQHALSSLETAGLLDETVRIEYNRVTLSKAQALLQENELAAALKGLQDHPLQSALPNNAIKDILLKYTQQQLEQENWEQADQALAGLRELVNDADTQAAQLNLFHQWGDALLTSQLFDQAITIYRRELTKDFKSKIAGAYLGQAKWFLDQHRVVEAADSYRHALATQNTKTTQQQTQADLKRYFDQCRQSRLWPQASNALDILLDLKLTGTDGPAWQIDLELDQAEAELEQDHLETAFQHLANLGDENQARIKSRVRDYIRKKASPGGWKNGANALNRLKNLLAQDPEPTYWYANWLFRWAEALFSEDKPDSEPAQKAHKLCQEILDEAVAPPETPWLDLMAEAETPPTIEPAGLRHQVCNLAAKIGLTQAQASLNRNNLDEAIELFRQTLRLSAPPETVKGDIRDKLQAFSDSQWVKEEWDLNRRAQEAILDLGVGDPETRKEIIDRDIQKAHLMFKGDEPHRAFDILDPLKTQVSETERQQIRNRAYTFSRLYAGRDCWDKEAKVTLERLRVWLSPADDAQEMTHALDELNREKLDFIRGKHEAVKPIAVPVEELELLIEHLQAEIAVIQAGYDTAKTPELKLDTLDAWAEELIKVRLALGQAHLAHNDLISAIQTYEEALSVACQSFDPKKSISHDLRHYSERMLYQKNWDEARLALKKLKSLDLPAPDDRTQPDPREDGAIQRVLLAYAQALLDNDQIAETFNQLRQMPPPWPEGAVKNLIFDYSDKRRGSRKGWPKAISALEQLYEFLPGDRQGVRDQQALNWLVAGLEEYGKFLKAEGKLTDAAKEFYKGLKWTREAREPKSSELAAHYIEVALELAQIFLEGDPCGSETSAVDQAVEWYQNILKEIDERTATDEDKINQTLYRHAFERLAKAKQWPRVDHLLAQLDALYPNPTDDYKTLFATWRRDLTLAEAQTWLRERNLSNAFACLKKLKEELNGRKAPYTTWPNTINQVKTLVYHNFGQNWLHDKAWPLATDALAYLDDLIPHDSEIIGWQVDAYWQWGQVLQNQNRWPEALKQYDEALKKTPKQQQVSEDQIEQDLLETQLAYARQHLAEDGVEDGLNKALAIYREALQKKSHDYLNRADKIRQDLKRHSDRLIQPPPNWPAAHQALASLQDLGLKNNEVSESRRTLTLQNIEYLLFQEDKVEAAFALLMSPEAMEPPWPLSQIQAITHRYWKSRVRVDTWTLARDALEHLGKITVETPAVRQWVSKELTELSQSIRVELNLPEEGREVLKLALELTLIDQPAN
ncbi:MAG: hypothetical protein DPW09_27440 [Anaerolineae bacterium]|nr:tetratricopeptide repeat protein [Anaerolineales bacterium]MCQ3977179.1 hypothetical protein [Anaerolineae bacterium]